MSLRDDFKRPLNEVKNALLRRIPLIVTSFIMIPTIVVLGIVYGIFNAIVEIKGILALCWNGEELTRSQSIDKATKEILMPD